MHTIKLIQNGLLSPSVTVADLPLAPRSLMKGWGASGIPDTVTPWR